MDGWDALGIVGAALLLLGVALWSVPAAMVLAGGLLLFLYYLRETRLAPRPIEVREPVNREEN